MMVKQSLVVGKWRTTRENLGRRYPPISIKIADIDQGSARARFVRPCVSCAHMLEHVFK